MDRMHYLNLLDCVLGIPVCGYSSMLELQSFELARMAGGLEQGISHSGKIAL